MTTATQTTGTDTFVQTPPDGGGKSVAATLITRDDGSQVYRQEIVAADPISSDAKGAVKMGAATGTEYGPVIWLAPAPQIQELIDIGRKQLDALNQIISLLGGVPAA